jgi:hypothetical protein
MFIFFCDSFYTVGFLATASPLGMVVSAAHHSKAERLQYGQIWLFDISILSMLIPNLSCDRELVSSCDGGLLVRDGYRLVLVQCITFKS